MRIGLIAEHYPPTHGGVATSARRIARSLAAAGADVHVLCFDTTGPVSVADYVREEVDGSVRVSRVGPFFLKNRDIPQEALPEKVRAILRRRAFEQMTRLARGSGREAILSLYVLNAGFIAAMVARELGLPHLLGVRGNDVGRNLFHVDRFGIVSWTLHAADTIVCVNHFLRHRLLLAHPDLAERCNVVPNGVHVPPRIDRERARARLLAATGWSSDSVIFGFAGVMREKKGVVSIVDAAHELDGGSLARLLVVGPDLGPIERVMLGERWDRLCRAGRIHVTGTVERDRVNSYMAGADVVLMPSIDDGMANALLEGMALGLPALASDVFSDVVDDGRTGWIATRGDAASLVATVRTAETSPLLEAMGRKARAHVAKAHRPSDEAQAYLKLLEECLDGGG